MRTFEEIIEDMNALAETVREAGNNELGIQGKIKLSGDLAWIVNEIRRKYELTSFYYCIAEQQAADRYNDKYGKD